MTQLTWVYTNFPPAQGTAGVGTFLNAPLRQGPGEASAAARDDGSVGLFYLEPGSLGTSAQPMWVFLNFPTTDAAVTYLNEPFRQGVGQVSATPRSNGSVGLFFLEPGSLGTITSPTWLFRDFPTTAEAITFLNLADRQGAGQVSAIARNDGSVGLFFLEPGSLGATTQQTWAFRDFPTTDAAVTFLNEPARQGPGEASAFARNDGSVSLFYLEPGTG
jgi:hypothetical protein